MFRNKQNKLNTAILLIAVAAVVFISPVAAEEPDISGEPHLPGTVEGTGTYFEVADSNYIDITFESTEPVHLRLESAPRMVTMDIEGTTDADSTQITLGGFAPDTTYYMYQDDYHNLTEMTTDQSGSCTYTQDLTERHLVFIQPEPSTIFLSDLGWSKPVGTWDPCTLTATLTQDVYETIQIDSDGITLDGGGFSLIGSGTGYGVYLYQRSNVTITNLTVEGFYYGIHLSYDCQNNTLTGNIVSNNFDGIRLYDSSSNTLTGNIASNNYYGIRLYDSSSNTLTDNTTSNNNYGIYFWYSPNNTLTANTTSNNVCGIYVHFSSGCTLTDNTASNNSYGIWLFHSSGNTLLGNTASNNVNGIDLHYSSGCTLTQNTASDNLRGIFLRGGGGHTVADNTASSNRYGIYIINSSNNTLTGNTTNSNSLYGIVLQHSNCSILTGNTDNSNNICGIYITYSDYCTLTGNTVSNNYYYGIDLLSSSNNLIYNNNFIDNYAQARVYGTSTDNVFNLSEAQGGGNYWSDWTTPDADGDGFVDSPYIFRGGQDDLPLVSEVVSETEPPVITEIDYDEADDTTTVAGTAEAGAVITIYDEDGVILCETTADENGNWECVLDGDYEGTVISVTASGPGGESDPAEPPAAPVIDSVDYDEADDTTTVAGIAEPNAVITIYDENSDVLCETITDENGDWECVLSGDHQGDITVTASDEDGNTSPAANVPPVADAGADLTVTDSTWPLGYEAVTLDGAGSYDPDGTIVSYSWSQGGTSIADGAAPTLLFDVGLYDLELTVTDNDGAADTSSVVITVLQADPATMIGVLTDEVESFNLQQGIANSLDAKLQNIQAALTAANAGLRQDAINKLEAFEAACEAQRDKMLTSEQADALIRDANYIIQSLQQ